MRLALLLASCVFMPAVSGISLNLGLLENSVGKVEFGSLPDWVNGTLYMNGPSLHDFTNFGVDLVTGHFFDGLGGIVRVNMEDGEIRIKTKFVESETFKRLRDHGQYDSFTFGTPLSWSSLAQAPHGVLFDNTPINLYYANGTMYATSDSVYRNSIDQDSLETMGSFQFDGRLGAAHPAVDPHNGEVFNYGGPHSVSFDFNSFSVVGEYSLVREIHREDDIEREELARVWAPFPWIAHSVGLTSDFVIYRITSERLGMSMPNAVLSNFIHFHPEEPVQYVLLNRKANMAKTHITCDQDHGFSSFHIINAFQEGRDTVIVDSVASDSGLLNDRTNDVFSRGYKPSSGTVNADEIPYIYKRCELSVAMETCKCHDLFQYPFELPAINPNVKTQKHRFVWAASGKGHTIWTNEIVKFDLENYHGKHSTFTPPDGLFVTEPTFIPTPGGQAEDDGLIFTFLLSPHTSSFSRIAILNAKTMKLEGLYRVPIDLPILTHAIFQDRANNNKVYPN